MTYFWRYRNHKLTVNAFLIAEVQSEYILNLLVFPPLTPQIHASRTTLQYRLLSSDSHSRLRSPGRSTNGTFPSM